MNLLTHLLLAKHMSEFRKIYYTFLLKLKYLLIKMFTVVEKRGFL